MAYVRREPIALELRGEREAREAPEPPPPPDAGAERAAGSRLWDRLAALVVLLLLALSLHAAWRVGPTFDEHTYAASGVGYWRTGDFAANREHPPLCKLLIGLPLVLAGVDYDAERDPDRVNQPAWWMFQRHGDDLRRNLFLARLLPCLVTAGLAALCYRVARGMLGARAAFVALLLVAGNPNVIAHGSLAALDGGLTAFTFLAVVAVVRALEARSAGRTLAAGAALGLACLAKFTALLLVPAVALLGLLAAARARSAAPLGTVALALLAALSTFGAGYLFEARSVNAALGHDRFVVADAAPDQDVPGPPAPRRVFTQEWIARPVRALFGDERPVPLFTALKGVDFQAQHASSGHDTYFAGRVLRAGEDFENGNPVPHYYLIVLLVKSPIGWLLLALLGVALAFRAGPGWSLLRGAAYLGTPLVLLAALSAGNALLGVKVVLPVVPFLALCGARVAVWWPRTALALALAGAAEGLASHPHELMFYNAAAGGSARGHEVTVVGDDWGQGVTAVARFYARYAEEIERAGGLYYEPYSAADPAALGLERARPVRGAVRGILAVHLVDLRRGGPTYAPLEGYEPFLVLDRSVYVYDLREPAPGGDPLSGWDAARAQ